MNNEERQIKHIRLQKGITPGRIRGIKCTSGDGPPLPSIGLKRFKTVKS